MVSTTYYIRVADGGAVTDTTTDAEVAEGLSQRWGYRVSAVTEGI